MFKKKITYVDFNGTERKEDFFFHLSVVERARIEAKYGGLTLEEIGKKLQADQNHEEILKFLEELVLNSYGKKSIDGKRFDKNAEIRHEFEFSQAYAELFAELILDHGFTAAFAEGIATDTKTMPKPIPKPVELD